MMIYHVFYRRKLLGHLRISWISRAYCHLRRRMECMRAATVVKIKDGLLQICNLWDTYALVQFDLYSLYLVISSRRMDVLMKVDEGQ